MSRARQPHPCAVLARNHTTPGILLPSQTDCALRMRRCADAQAPSDCPQGYCCDSGIFKSPMELADRHACGYPPGCVCLLARVYRTRCMMMTYNAAGTQLCSASVFVNSSQVCTSCFEFAATNVTCTATAPVCCSSSQYYIDVQYPATITNGLCLEDASMCRCASSSDCMQGYCCDSGIFKSPMELADGMPIDAQAERRSCYERRHHILHGIRLSKFHAGLRRLPKLRTRGGLPSVCANMLQRLLKYMRVRHCRLRMS